MAIPLPLKVLALLADIHSNLEALESCLAHARARGATRFAFLGDLVGYGADPAAVIAIIAGHAADGAIVVKGNHDAAIAGGKGYLNAAATAAIEWSRGMISAGDRAFLDALPLCVRADGVCYVHASADSPERWTYIDSPDAARKSVQAAGAALTLSGHVHHQLLYVEGLGGRMVAFTPTPGVAVPVPGHRAALAIPGSVGQPRDRNPAACYSLADLGARRLTFHRVAYDHASAARKMRAAGLPEMLAHRLERGA